LAELCPSRRIVHKARRWCEPRKSLGMDPKHTKMVSFSEKVDIHATVPVPNTPHI